MVPKSSCLVWLLEGFYDVDQSQTPKPPPLLILPVLLGTITVAIPPDPSTAEHHNIPRPKASGGVVSTSFKFLMQNQEPTNPTNPTLEPPKKKKKKLHKVPIQWKNPNFPTSHPSQISITNLFQGKTHHENQGLFGLLWIGTREARIKFFSTLPSHDSSSALPPGYHLSASIALLWASWIARSAWRRPEKWTAMFEVDVSMIFSKAGIIFGINSIRFRGGVGDFTQKIKIKSRKQCLKASISAMKAWLEEQQLRKNTHHGD